MRSTSSLSVAFLFLFSSIAYADEIPLYECTSTRATGLRSGDWEIARVTDVPPFRIATNVRNREGWAVMRLTRNGWMTFGAGDPVAEDDTYGRFEPRIDGVREVFTFNVRTLRFAFADLGGYSDMVDHVAPPSLVIGTCVKL
jgi:hypothetical protein